jgi:hypothetical protein
MFEGASGSPFTPHPHPLSNRCSVSGLPGQQLVAYVGGIFVVGVGGVPYKKLRRRHVWGREGGQELEGRARRNGAAPQRGQARGEGRLGAGSRRLLAPCSGRQRARHRTPAKEAAGLMNAPGPSLPIARPPTRHAAPKRGVEDVARVALAAAAGRFLVARLARSALRGKVVGGGRRAERREGEGRDRKGVGAGGRGWEGRGRGKGHGVAGGGGRGGGACVCLRGCSKALAWRGTPAALGRQGVRPVSEPPSPPPSPPQRPACNLSLHISSPPPFAKQRCKPHQLAQFSEYWQSTWQQVGGLKPGGGMVGCVSNDIM